MPDERDDVMTEDDIRSLIREELSGFAKDQKTPDDEKKIRSMIREETKASVAEALGEGLKSFFSFDDEGEGSGERRSGKSLMDQFLGN